MKRVLRDREGNDVEKIEHHVIKINGATPYEGSLMALYVLLFFILGFFSALFMTGNIV